MAALGSVARALAFACLIQSTQGATCGNYGSDMCNLENDGGCKCMWDPEAETCSKTTECSGLGITSVGDSCSICPAGPSTKSFTDPETNQLAQCSDVVPYCEGNPDACGGCESFKAFMQSEGCCASADSSGTVSDSCADGLCEFRMTFGMDPLTKAPLRIIGQYPSGQSSPFTNPIVYLRGTGVGSMALTEDITSMAQAGMTAVAVMQYPTWDGSDFVNIVPTSSGLCDFHGAKAKALFGPSQDTGLSVLCSHPKIDCSMGVGVAGFSQGADIGILAAQLDGRVKGFFGLAASSALYAMSDELVLASDEQDFPATLITVDCAIKASNPLPSSALRFLVGSADKAWSVGGAMISNETARQVEVLNHKKMSGYHDCGNSADCIKSDGSGYKILEGVEHNELVDANLYSHVAEGFMWLKNLKKLLPSMPGTCGEVKRVYKEHGCCGNPSKEMKFATGQRRLASAEDDLLADIAAELRRAKTRGDEQAKLLARSILTVLDTL